MKQVVKLCLKVIFHLGVRPAGILARRLGRRPLDLGWRDGRGSYWL